MDAVFAPSDDESPYLLTVFLSSYGLCFLFCCLLNYFILDCRLKLYGQASSSRIDKKEYRPRKGSESSDVSEHELEYQHLGQTRKEIVEKSDYQDLKIDDEIEIIYDPKCPSYNFKIGTNVGKCLEDFKFFLCMFAVLGIGILGMIFGIVFSFSNRSDSDRVIYIFTGIIGSSIIGIVSCLLCNLSVCIGKECVVRSRGKTDDTVEAGL